MATATQKEENSGQTAIRESMASDSTVLEDARSLWHELLGLTHDHLLIATLEARQAGESLVSMMLAGIMAAFLLSAAWMGVMAAAVLGLIDNGIVASNAILLAVAFNLLFALILIAVIRRKSRSLQFPATLRSLQARPPVHRDAQK
ncbi:MAG: phage holin family protein [Methylococcales bacterium]|nr:phage holin family protein [Methylococcales bacterium]MDD5632460.1 phage holin family protein [Methylococcales bacterium]